MLRLKMVKPVLKEYGISWAVNRSLYSAKLKIMSAVPATEKLFEKKASFPQRLDIFKVDVVALQSFLRGELSNEDKEKLTAAADKACEGIIAGFSSLELDYGNPIDWQLNPLTGKRCNEYAKWYKIPDFDKYRGDIKVTWEVSRFSHFITFARAFLLTGDHKYYKAFNRQLGEWLEKNPYSLGANFKCSQECSFRMVNTLLAYTVFKESGVVVPANSGDVKCLIDRCYKKVLSNFSYAYKCIKNNHTISELMGMIIGAWCTKDSKRLDRAYVLLDEVIEEQFTNNGGYCQFSFNYQRLALQALEVVISVSEQTGRRLSSRSLEKIRKSAELMYQCQDGSGDMPNYGSNDGALVFPVTSCGYRDFRPVINTAYVLTAGNQLYEKDKHQEEILWFSGGKQIEDFAVTHIGRVSSQFPDAGLFTMRNINSWAMVVANNYHSRPAHMDQLHFDLWVDGTNVFCDAGTYSYASEEGRKLVKNESHNTASVENMKQMNMNGHFMICDWTKRKLGKTDADIFEGTVKSANGYTHKRRVRSEGNRYLITDKVDKDAFIFFHTPCDIKIDSDVVSIWEDGSRLAVIKSRGSLAIRESSRSLYYWKSEKTSCVAIRVKANEEVNTAIKIYGSRG